MSATAIPSEVIHYTKFLSSIDDYGRRLLDGEHILVQVDNISLAAIEKSTLVNRNFKSPLPAYPLRGASSDSTNVFLTRAARIVFGQALSVPFFTKGGHEVCLIDAQLLSYAISDQAIPAQFLPPPPTLPAAPAMTATALAAAGATTSRTPPGGRKAVLPDDLAKYIGHFFAEDVHAHFSYFSLNGVALRCCVEMQERTLPGLANFERKSMSFNPSLPNLNAALLAEAQGLSNVQTGGKRKCLRIEKRPGITGKNNVVVILLEKDAHLATSKPYSPPPSLPLRTMMAAAPVLRPPAAPPSENVVETNLDDRAIDSSARGRTRTRLGMDGRSGTYRSAQESAHPVNTNATHDASGAQPAPRSPAVGAAKLNGASEASSVAKSPQNPNVHGVYDSIYGLTQDLIAFGNNPSGEILRFGAKEPLEIVGKTFVAVVIQAPIPEDMEIGCNTIGSSRRASANALSDRLERRLKDVTTRRGICISITDDKSPETNIVIVENHPQATPQLEQIARISVEVDRAAKAQARLTKATTKSTHTPRIVAL